MTTTRTKRYKKPHKRVTRKRVTRKRVTRKRVTQKRTRGYKGGKVLGVGADGCVFSEAAWPCATPLPGYDPSDPTVVSKLVTDDDNEDHAIRLALSIVSPDDKKHLIGFIGTCKPATASDGTVYAKQLKENETDIFDMYDTYKWKRADYRWEQDQFGTPEYAPPYETSCIRLVDRRAVEAAPYKYKIYNNIKSIINKKYQQTFEKYMYDHVAATSFTPIIHAFVKYIHVLETLAEGVDGRRLVNIDLHGGNIFVNKEPTGELIVGAADFGRCAIQEGTTLDQRIRFTEYLLKYQLNFYIIFEYSVIPFELKLYSFLKRNRFTAYGTSVEPMLRTFIAEVLRQESKFYTTPFSLFNETTLFAIVQKYLLPFCKMIRTHTITDPREGVEFVRLCFLNRFTSLGTLQTLISYLITSDIYRSYTNVLGSIAKKLTDYLLHDVEFTPVGDLEILCKLYFDTLFAPHKELKDTPTPRGYITVLLRGGPHAFSTAMAAALTTLPNKRTVSYVSPPSPAPAPGKITRTKVTRTFIPGAAAAAAAVGTPRYVTRGAIRPTNI